MGRNLTRWFALAFLALAFVTDHKIACQIQGEDDTQITLTYRLGGKSFSDSALLKHGRVAFEEKFPEPVVCTLSNSKNQQIKIFVAQHAPIRVSGTINQFNSLNIEGALENDLFEAFKLKSRQLAGEYRKALELAGGDRKDKFNSHYLVYRNRIDSLTRTFIEANKDLTVASLAIIDSYMSVNEKKQAAVAYNLLSVKGLKSTYAARVKQFVDTEYVIVPGKAAPEFALSDLQNNQTKLSQYIGKYVLLDFWASWCPPCRAEHPLLKQLENKYGSRIQFVSISMDASADAWKKAVAFDQLTWTQLNDPQSTNGEVADSYGIKSLPFNCLVAPDGKILASKLRGKALEDFLAYLFQ